MVHIQSINMTGFKSFGKDKKTIKLAPGFTCIVGPNGSGKSNAIDAVSFCLGTLSKKSMRAEKLTDLLYSGTKTRKPAEKTLVEVIFNNVDRRIPINRDEVVVSRELRKDGKGMYRLNGKRSTRSDILDKLRIAGIDCVHGYNIIQQGQIGEIVGMSGIQRRELLESVAGVGQFDDKKAESIAELDEAQRKMGEVNLLISELTTRVDELRSEKEEAEKWINLGEKINKQKSEFLSLKIHLLKEEIDKLSLVIDEKNKSIENLESSKKDRIKIEEMKNLIEAKANEIRSVETKHKVFLEQINSIKIEYAKLDQLKDFNLETQEEREQDIKKGEFELKKFANIVTKKENEIKSIEDELKILFTQQLDLINERKHLDRQINEKENEYNDAKEGVDRIEHHFRNLRNKITKLEISHDLTASIVENFDRNVAAKNREITEIEKKVEKEEAEIQRIQAGIDKETNNLEDLKQDLNRFNEPLETNLKQIEIKEKNAKDISDEILVSKTKVEMIQSSLQEGKSTNTAYEYIIQNQKQFNGFIGSFDEFIDFSNQSVYGVQNVIIMEKLNDVITCIGKLKENIVGSCNFLPLEFYNLQKGDSEDSIKDQIKRIFQLVDNINDASELWVANKEMLIHTKEGDFIYPNGIIFGGFHEESAESQLHGLGDKISIDEDEYIRVKEEIQRTKNINEQIHQAQKITEISITNLKKEIRDLIVQLRHSESTKIQLNTLLKRLLSERSAIDAANVQRRSQLDKTSRERNELNIEKERVENDLVSAQKVLESQDVSQLRALHQQIYEELLQSEKKKVRLEERKINLEDSLNQTNDRTIEVKVVQDELKENLSQLIDVQGQTLKFIEEKLQSKETKNVELQTFLTKQNELKQEVNEITQQIRTFERQNSSINSKTKMIKDEINNIVIKRVKFETEKGSFIEDARENDFEILKINEELSKLKPSSIQSQITRNSNLRKNLEPVNMKSMQDFDNQNQRLNKLTDRRNVLTEERDVILEFIVQLEIEKVNTFTKSFNKINVAFNNIFLQLSGGNAKLIIENEEDVFSGGIFIEAHPGGKTVKSLEAMSGGEKALTAIAFIFAIQQSEPQPFYILDEIDAFLDIKNVDKVARLLAKMSEGTSAFGKAQFLVISHRDILMAKAETIYGTTNVKGLTQMIQIQLGDTGLYKEVTKYEKI